MSRSRARSCSHHRLRQRRLLNITPVNDLPIPASQNVTVAEDAPLSLVLNATDPEADPVTSVVITGPSHGTLSGSAPNLTYAPAKNYFGADSFTFKASDGSGDSGPASISINVTPVNDPPIAVDQVFDIPHRDSVSEDLSVSIRIALLLQYASKVCRQKERFLSVRLTGFSTHQTYFRTELTLLSILPPTAVTALM